MAAFAALMTDRETMRFMAFPEELKTNDTVIRRVLPELVDLEDGAELMYVIAKPRRQRGYATEVASALTRHAVRDLGFRSVVAFIVARNVASRKAAEHAGLRDAGIVQRDGFSEGPVHAYVYRATSA